ncbi:MAG: hypothetical protein KDB88_01510 [Flavobacteriales bacterium]|nr:hypothetical protein [Flavobacteriales bacterium]
MLLSSFRVMLALWGLVAIGTVSGQVRKVLFIGNSYTNANGLPNLFSDLALSLGDTVETLVSALGGYTLQQHAAHQPTLDLIASTQADVVIIQEQSQRPAFPIAQVQNEVFPYAQQLVDAVRAADSCSQIVFYMTWGRESGDQQNCANWPPVCSYEGMQALLRERYLQMALMNGAAAAPVGAAWAQVRSSHPSIDLYAPDGSHPSASGSYLAACTFYSTIFRRPSVGALIPGTVDPANGLVLQAVSSALVLDSMATWNIGSGEPQAIVNWSDIGANTISFQNLSMHTTEHFWDFGDGSTSTVASPDHMFPGPFPFTVTYLASNACGISDTLVLDVFFGPASVPERSNSPSNWWVSGDMLRGRSGQSGQLELFDALGRKVLSITYRSREEFVIPWPSAWKGTFLWHSRNVDGDRSSGRILVP